MKKELKIALISHLFPTESHSILGKFIKDHIELLNEEDWILPTLLVPTPYSFPLTERYKRNNSSLLYDPHHSQRLKYLSFPRKTFPQLALKSLTNKLEKFFRTNTVDGVHLHWLYPDGLAIPTLHDLGLKTILTIHGSDWYKNHSNKTLKPLIEETFEKADRILLVGPNLVKDIKSVFPRHKDKLFEIGNYINEDFYKAPTSEQKNEALRSLNWSSHKKHFLTVANFRREKGIDILMDVINNIPKSHSSSVEFHIVGTSDTESISISTVPEQVSLHPPVAPQDLITYYLAADTYISPSRKEGFGLALIEAAACGLPIIATSTGIAPDFIDDEIGFLCSTNSSQALADSILELLKKFEDYDPQEIRNKAVRMFGKETYRDKLLAHYRECFVPSVN